MLKDKKRICIFCGSSLGNNKLIQKEVIKLAKIISENNLELVYGGAKIGLMGLIAKEVQRQGGKVIGIIPKFLNKKEIINKNLSELHLVDSMHERKQKMYDISDFFIALPGGIGTLEEVFEIITWKQLKLKKAPIGILNISKYYDKIIEHIHLMVKNDFLHKNFIDEIIVSNSSKDLINRIIN